MENNYREAIVKKNEEANVSIMECVANVFSAIMEEEVTPQQASCILNIILSLIVLVFTIGMPVFLQIITFAWLGVSVWQGKKSGLLGEK